MKTVEEDKVEIEWMIKIINMLSGKNLLWGCLSAEGKLFEVRTFSTVEVPKCVINSLVKDNVIQLEKAGAGNGKIYYHLCKEEALITHLK